MWVSYVVSVPANRYISSSSARTGSVTKLILNALGKRFSSFFCTDVSEYLPCFNIQSNLQLVS